MVQINEHNAHEYNDEFTILTPAGFFVGCEHNPTEAKAVLDWLNGQRGGGYTMRRNGREEVRQAKAFRRDVLRYEWRDEALEGMGVI